MIFLSCIIWEIETESELQCIHLPIILHIHCGIRVDQLFHYLLWETTELLSCSCPVFMVLILSSWSQTQRDVNEMLWNWIISWTWNLIKPIQICLGGQCYRLSFSSSTVHIWKHSREARSALQSGISLGWVPSCATWASAVQRKYKFGTLINQKILNPVARSSLW